VDAEASERELTPLAHSCPHADNGSRLALAPKRSVQRWSEERKRVAAGLPLGGSAPKGHDQSGAASLPAAWGEGGQRMSSFRE